MPMEASQDQHITNICSKANQMLGIGCLRRNLKINSTSTKDLAYKALVRPILDIYASAVWNPHLQKHINRIEAAQRRAAHFMWHRNTSSVNSMLNQLNWPPLQ